MERTHRFSGYDKRIIAEAVFLAESGVPRKVVTEQFNLGKYTLKKWMRLYGSLEYHKNKRKSYSNTEKRKIVHLVLSGQMTIGEAVKIHHISSEDLIRNWIRNFNSENADIAVPRIHEMPQKQVYSSLDEVEKLRKALQAAQLKIEALNTLIDVAEDQLKIDIRKKSGAKQSSK